MPRPTQDLQNIARTWAIADWLGTSTTNLVADRHGITARHATRLIHQARDAGLIPRRRPNHNGQRARKKIRG